MDEGEVLALLQRVPSLRIFGFRETFQKPVRQSGTLPNREFQRFGFKLFRGRAHGYRSSWSIE